MKRKLLLATAAATLAFAAPAAANPLSDLGPLSGPGGDIVLAGGNSAAPAHLDWNLVGGVPQAALDGRLFMTNAPNAQARARVYFYDNAISHTLLSTQAGPVRNGVAGVAAFGANVGPQPGSAHAHVELLVNGGVVDSQICTMGVALCW